MSNENSTVVVTGASSMRGIGRATALRLARDGWNVAVLSLDKDGAESTAREAALHGVRAIGVVVDIASEPAVDRAVAEVERELPPVLGLANIAGITLRSQFLDTTRDGWDHTFAVNATGTFLMSRRVGRGMVERGAGRIVNMSSVAAIRGGGMFGGVAYSASKAAILGMTRALAREWGPLGVTVNAIAPGVVDTDIRAHATTPELEAELSAQSVLGRQATTGEIAALVSFLLSDDASYITGATYDINGGAHIS